jgi:uncharacterized protein (TIGR04255 family)
MEAICGFEVEAAITDLPQSHRIAKIIAAFGERFPSVEPLAAPTISMDLTQVLGRGIGQILPGASQMVPANGWRLATESRDRTITIIGNSLLYSCPSQFPSQSAYPGGEAFIEEILSAWEKYAAIVAPTALTRMSMRYVNGIPRTADKPAVSDWLRATGSIPGHIVNSVREPVVLRVESWLSERSLMIVTVGIAQGLSSPLEPIIFDLDRLEIGPQSILTSNISDIIRRIHNDIWVEFDAATTDHFRSYLRGGI